MRPRDTAEMNVPAKAKVNMEPMLRKKFAYLASVWTLSSSDMLLLDAAHSQMPI